MSEHCFRLEQQGRYYRVMERDTQVMEFCNFDMFMAGYFIIGANVFCPGGPRRICNWIPFWQGFVPPRREVKISMLEGQESERLRIRLQPDDQACICSVRSEMTFTWDPEMGSYAVEHEGWLEFREEVTEDKVGGFHSNAVEGEDTPWHWQWDDPNYENNYGPSVPMQQDWYNQHEPHTGPDTFRAHWQRAVTHFICQEPSGKVRTIRAHRGMIHALPQNINCMPLKPGGLVGVRTQDGCGVIYDLLTDQPANAQICGWGFDHHYRQPLPVKDGLPDLGAGDVLHCHYCIREWPAEKMEQLLADAEPLEPPEEMWSQVDLPIYEEPVCNFQTSWADPLVPDAWPWVPGRGATWDRETGHVSPGSLRLDRHGDFEAEAEWTTGTTGVGPSFFGNPFIPGERYRLSAWVRVKQHPPYGVPPVRLGVALHYFKGPSTYGKPLPLETYWGEAVDRCRGEEWTHISVETPPIDGFCAYVTPLCRLTGPGTAWFDEVRFERIAD